MTIRVGYDAKLKDVRWPFDPPKCGWDFDSPDCPCRYHRHRRAFQAAKQAEQVDVDHETPQNAPLPGQWAYQKCLCTGKPVCENESCIAIQRDTYERHVREWGKKK